NAWPIGLMCLVMFSGLLAAITPWTFRFVRTYVPFALIPAVAAAVLWYVYERELDRIFPPGDPLIRVDYLILLPLSFVVVASVALGLIIPRRRP
ncbi:MAG: hypothetical protein JNG88_11800, partial [Phycisphaerales bacterium]|nr:hypothetical protein [Phycisphaerales bacterium]